jgi:hypothetical protein
MSTLETRFEAVFWEVLGRNGDAITELNGRPDAVNRSIQRHIATIDPTGVTYAP